LVKKKKNKKNKKNFKKVKERIAVNGFPSHSYGTSLAMRSHSVTCYPTQVNVPRLNPSQKAGTRFTYSGGLPGNAPAGIRTRDLSITSPTPYHYTTEEKNKNKKNQKHEQEEMSKKLRSLLAR